jgi:hypothetical protein
MHDQGGQELCLPSWKLLVKPRGRKECRLERRGHVRVTPEISFTLTGAVNHQVEVVQVDPALRDRARDLSLPDNPPKEVSRWP